MNIAHLAFILLQAMQKQIREYRKQLPENLTVVFVELQSEAPQSLVGLRYCVDELNLLPVALEHGDCTIYQGDWANGIFRVFHDMGHYIYNNEMTCLEEMQLAIQGWKDLVPHFPADAPMVELYRLYAADTIGQSVYCDRTGRFPTDQVRFVELMLESYEKWEQSTEGHAEDIAELYPNL